MKLSQLITKLKYEITPKEWELLEARDSTIKISEHNRKTLLEMKNTQITKDKEVSTDVINDLKLELETYLNKYMASPDHLHLPRLAEAQAYRPAFHAGRNRLALLFEE